MTERAFGQVALVAISRHGAELARRLVRSGVLGSETECWITARWVDPRVPFDRSFDLPVRPLVADLFDRGRTLVLFMPVGAAVRLIGPMLCDKRAEPAVVVVDDAGRFAVSLVGGHAAGANRLVEAVARALGATPVVTTGAEALGVPVAETLGTAHGWRVDAPPADVTRLSAAFVNGETVGWYQDAGETLPESDADTVIRLPSLAECDDPRLATGVVVIDRLLLDLPPGWVVYRPATLAVGVGASRGVSADEIEQLVRATLLEEGLSLASARVLGTIDLKQAEAGLLEAARRLGLMVQFFTAAELATITDLPTPSEVVRQHVGVAGVAEPAAILAAGGGDLIVWKRTSPMATVAVARRRTNAGDGSRATGDGGARSHPSPITRHPAPPPGGWL